jgi:hypothetical protein
LCFGDQKTDTKTTTSTANPAVANAATSNLNFVQGLQTQGFTPYSGQQVADFSPQQASSFGMTNNIANNGTAPAAQSMINNYASAPASSVSADSISNNMSPYMNQYVMQALAPQLQQQDWQNAATQQQTNATATGSGAFGDARTGIQQAQNQQNANVAREGLIGNAYNSAFNTAIGAGAQDVSNKLQAGTTNANLSEQALNRSLGGATALEGLQNQQLGVATAQNAAGAQQTAQQQAGLTAQYNQWLMAQQYPFQTAQLMNQTVGAGAAAMPASTTSVDLKPDNSGLAALGSIAGSALPLMLSDERVKENKRKIGKLRDGTDVWSFNILGDPRPQIGLMAQDVKKRRPDAVHELWEGGPMIVDYERATALSRAMAGSI